MFYKLLIAMIAASFVTSVAASAATVRVGEVFETKTAHFTNKKIEDCKPKPQNASAVYADNAFDDAIAMGGGAALSCSAKQTAKNVLGVASISLSLGAVGAACTGVLAPFSVQMATVAVGVQVLEFVLEQVECYDKEADEKNHRLINQQICEAFVKKGIDCDPAQLQ